ncbi:glycoprotein [Streptomyces sp. NPDC059816]|uniref:glycoprotein n=1 Tax=Streptomyces sp. NPDC059816 TaxID=3346960 RepID=UPI0036564702
MRTHPRTVDAALQDAGALPDAYTSYDTAAALERVERELAPEPRTTAAAWPAPRLSRTEQAGRDLNLAATMVVNAPSAAASMRLLLDQQRIDPSSALPFAALLYLVGYTDGARFWWEFAAGGGDATAAFCLSLFHEARAEFRTARHWRRENLALGRGERRDRGPRRRAVRALLRGRAPRILPDDIRHDLVARCHQGDRPVLPPAVEAIVHALSVESDDGDFGEIPRPDNSLTSLAHEPARYRWSLREAARRTWSTIVIRHRTRTSKNRS